MKNKTLIFWKIMALLLLTLNITMACFILFWGPEGMPPFMRSVCNPGQFLSEKLKFSNQQEVDFEKLREAHHDSILVLLTEGMKMRKVFFDRLKSGSENVYNDTIADQIAENQKQIELVTYNHLRGLKMICSPKQKIIFNNIIHDVIERLGKPPMRPFAK